MPSPQDMIDEICRHDRERLLQLYDQIAAGQTPAFWSDGLAFEHLVLRAFGLEGVEVWWPYRVLMPASQNTMEQIDGVLYIDAMAILVESKDTQEAQSIEPIAKLKSQLDRRPPQTMGLVVSRAGFTAPAATLTRFVSGGRILLWRGDELRHALSNSQVVATFRRKYRHLVEQAVPDLLVLPEDALSAPAEAAGGDPNGTDTPG